MGVSPGKMVARRSDQVHSTTRAKAKAEAGVQVVQRWIVAALRHRRFFSLAEVNEAKKLVRRVPSESEVSTWVTEAKSMPAKVSH